MSIFFFVYTVLLLLLCIFAASSLLSAFFVCRRRVFAAGTAFFALYVCELALIFLDEYTLTKPVIDMSVFDLPMTHPQLKLVLSVLLMAALWLAVLEFTERVSRPRFLVPIAVLAAAQALSLLAHDDNLVQWLFYGSREVFTFWCAIFIVVVYRTCGDDSLRRYLGQFRVLFVVLTLLSVGIFIEDTVHIMFKAYLIQDTEFIYYLSERNITENVFVALIAVFALRTSSETLSIRFEEPATISTRAQERAETRIARYCARQGLTPREREVLELMLEGKDNQNIASALQLSVGAVKSHVHSIYSKTGSTSRQEFLQSFWGH